MLSEKSFGKRRKTFVVPASSFLALVLIFLLVGCGGATQAPVTNQTPNATPTNDHGLAALPGYQISLFASSTSAYNNPDAVVLDNGHIFIDYQNTSAKDCTDNNSSTVVEYTMDGKVVKTFSVPGHSDGMRADPATHLLWTTSCEDGNPKMATIDTTSGVVTPYTFAKTPHGGGYDDVYFLNGMTFIAASNPTLDKNNKNPYPAVDQITLSNGQAVLKPILLGNATVTNTTTTPPSQLTLNLTDPDSLSTDGKGNLILVAQADDQLITISNPGTAQQSVSTIPVGTQLDDTVWTTSTHGRLLVADGHTGLTFWMQAPQYTQGSIFTEAPSDSGVAGFVGLVDPATGIITPVVIGLLHPTGMIFVPA
ncbi:MAG TPA: hypothetical protein VGD98_18460 [Ktedonobacteraceae bacterium]